MREAFVVLAFALVFGGSQFGGPVRAPQPSSSATEAPSSSGAPDQRLDLLGGH